MWHPKGAGQLMQHYNNKKKKRKQIKHFQEYQKTPIARTYQICRNLHIMQCIRTSTFLRTTQNCYALKKVRVLMHIRTILFD